MTANQQLQFLQEKIKEINSAIFFNLSDSVLKFPTTIVSTLKVDDFGYVWFFVKKPKQNINEFETEFPVRLDYFKKGTEYFLQIMGKAWVITDPEEVNTFVTLTDEVKDYAVEEDVVLVKVKMMKADYQETQSRNSNSWWANAVNQIFTWFRSSDYRPGTYFHAQQGQVL
jgi:general stress protein 26